MSASESSCEQPPRVHVDGSRVLVSRYVRQDDGQNLFEPMLATPADESAKQEQDKQPERQEHAQVK